MEETDSEVEVENGAKGQAKGRGKYPAHCMEAEDKVDEGLSEIVDGAEDNVEFDPAELRKARGEELAYVCQIGMYGEVPIQDCWDSTGRGPASAKWVGVMKHIGGRSFAAVAAAVGHAEGDVDTCAPS